MEVQSKVHEEKARLEKVLPLVALIFAFCAQHKTDALEFVDKMAIADWAMFARLTDKPYPSAETREMVRAAVFAAQMVIAHRALCKSCGVNPATRSAGKGGRLGADLCDFCWRQETDHGGAA
jgi:hypothetical protein